MRESGNPKTFAWPQGLNGALFGFAQ